MVVTVKTYRHIVLEFRSTGAAAEEVNEIANAKTEAILQSIGQCGVTGREKGKEVYWNVQRV